MPQLGSTRLRNLFSSACEISARPHHYHLPMPLLTAGTELFYYYRRKSAYRRHFLYHLPATYLVLSTQFVNAPKQRKFNQACCKLYVSVAAKFLITNYNFAHDSVPYLILCQYFWLKLNYIFCPPFILQRTFLSRQIEFREMNYLQHNNTTW